MVIILFCKDLWLRGIQRRSSVSLDKGVAVCEMVATMWQDIL